MLHQLWTSLKSPSHQFEKPARSSKTLTLSSASWRTLDESKLYYLLFIQLFIRRVVLLVQFSAHVRPHDSHFSRVIRWLRSNMSVVNEINEIRCFKTVCWFELRLNRTKWKIQFCSACLMLKCSNSRVSMTMYVSEKHSGSQSRQVRSSWNAEYAEKFVSWSSKVRIRLTRLCSCVLYTVKKHGQFSLLSLPRRAEQPAPQDIRSSLPNSSQMRVRMESY